MTHDPIALLERELVAAAARRAAESLPAEASEPGGPIFPHRVTVPESSAEAEPGRGLGRRLGGGVVTAASVTAVLIVALVALLALHGRAPSEPHGTASRHRAPASAPAAASRRALLRTVGVLRRPQTGADLRALRLSGVLGGRRGGVPLEITAQGTPIPSSARVAALTPWGAPVVLVMLAPLSTARRAAAGVSPPPGSRSLAAEQTTLLMVSPAGLSGARDVAQLRAGQDWSIGLAADVRAGRDWNLTSAGAGARSAGRPSAVRYAVVVPDGVVRVTFHVRARGAYGHRAGGPAAVTVPVHGNVAVVQIHHACCDVPVMTWLGPRGRVIRQAAAPSSG